MAAALAWLLQYKFNKWVEVDINKLFIHLLWFDEHYSIIQCVLPSRWAEKLFNQERSHLFQLVWLCSHDCSLIKRSWGRLTKCLKHVPFMQLLSVYRSGLSGPLGGIWSHRGWAHACIPGAHSMFVSNLNAPPRKSKEVLPFIHTHIFRLVLEGNGGLHNLSKNDDSSVEIVQTCKVPGQGHFLHQWVHKTLQ